ncbi:MAG: SNAP receptor [Alyxoria varia]|nr:MAG: SNAP receptor [Alyxoria varia]
MVVSTQISRLDGLMLAASVDDEQSENELADIKAKVKQIFRRLDKNSEPQATIECGQYTLHYLISDSICFLTITSPSYPRKLAFTYLSDLSAEFQSTYSSQQYLSPTLRPYAFVEFDTFIQRTKKTYQDSRASQNLDKLNSELKDVTKVMTKNIEDLLYRGDSLEKMGELSDRLREDSRRYKKAAVRINWELLLRQYGPFAAFGLIVIIFIYWRFLS